MDNYSKVEQLLRNYKMMKVYIVNLREEIRFINNDISLTGIDYSGISTSPTNKVVSSTEDEALIIMSRVHKLEQEINGYRFEIDRVDRSLDALEKTECDILVERYINSSEWWVVSSKVRYSESHCRSIRRKAIRKLEKGLYGLIGM